jgi:glycogen(starch) synthase
LLPALSERGYELVVVTSQSSPDLPDNARYKGVPVYRFPFWKADKNIDELMKIRQRIISLKRAFAPDLIHRNAVSGGDFFLLTTAHAHPAPLLVTLHGAWPNQADTLVRRTLRAADWVVGVSAAILEQGRQLEPEIIPRSSIICNALDEPALLPEPLPIQAPRLLCLGRLAAVKGFDLALLALTSIVDRFPSVRLIVAGDGPERTKLREQVVKFGLSEIVQFIGWVAPDVVPALMNTATVVVMPSRWESLPLVALEGALMARPVVGTRVGGLPEVVLHQQTGLLVEEEDSQALAEAIAFLLQHPETATRMGQAARSRVLDIFSLQRHVDAYEALYRKLVTDWRERNSTGTDQGELAINESLRGVT